jgi:3-phenylpropionate/trans-cinnamate dioxygenase ferredoxin subunit
MATIKVIQNGPYLVQGEDVTAVDWNGATYLIPKRPFALCRCGGSTTKPFCDGTHSRSGFKAAEAAVPGSQDKPATKALVSLRLSERVPPHTRGCISPQVRSVHCGRPPEP